MSVLINNLIELVNMIFQVVVRPNLEATNSGWSLLNHLYAISDSSDATMVRNVILLTFGILLTGVSIGMIKRFLWKS